MAGCVLKYSGPARQKGGIVALGSKSNRGAIVGCLVGVLSILTACGLKPTPFGSNNSHRDQCSTEHLAQEFIGTWRVTAVSDSASQLGIVRFEGDGLYFRDSPSGKPLLEHCGGWGCWESSPGFRENTGTIRLYTQSPHMFGCADATILARYSVLDDTLRIEEEEGWWGPSLEWTAVKAD